MQSPRRDFLMQLGGAAAAGVLASMNNVADASDQRSVPVATNVYPWTTFYKREGKDFNADLDAGLAAVAEAGLDGFEPIARKLEDIDNLAPLLAKHKLSMKSLYVNSTLHDDKADESIRQAVAIAERAKAVGTTIIVTNPSPMSWKGSNGKDDAMLRRQAHKLDELGRQLRAIDMTLAYHFHHMEFEKGAREVHHMLCATNPENVTLCLDAHWCYRGAGDSSVALFDLMKLYGTRITELHLRQSVGGIWTETFGEGDIDYPALVERIVELKLKPHVVLEQSVEAKTPTTMDAITAHRQSTKYARNVFAALA